MSDTEKKSELKLLGVTLNEHPCNWDTLFDHLFSKASYRLFIMRVCKYYGYSLQESYHVAIHLCY